MNRRIGIAALALTLVMLIASMSGLRLNLKGSGPIGLWIEQEKPDSPKRAILVSVCPPDIPVVRLMAARGALGYGDCKGADVTPLLKAVGAISGDLVKIRAGMPVQVNGQVLPNTIALDNIESWPDGDYTVQPGQIWVFSTYNINSFDSRYFGPVPASDILGIAKPLIIRGSPEDMHIGVIQ